MLRASVAAGESGPVITLAGEADLTCAVELAELIAAQLAGGTRQLTIELSGLRFADSASIRVLVLAARTLTERGGSLVLLDPQRPVASVLALLGVDQIVTIRVAAEATPGPEPGAREARGLARTRPLHGPDADRPGPTGWERG